MEFSSLQGTGKVSDKVRDKFSTKRRGLDVDTIHESRRRDLCRGLS